MQIRNRNTKKNFEAQNGSLSKSKSTLYHEKPLDTADFNEQLHTMIEESKVPDAMREGIEKLLSAQQAPSPKVKLERAEKFIAICAEGAPLLEAAQEDPSFVDTINAEAAKIGGKIQQAMAEPSFAVELAKAVGGAHAAAFLNGLVPGGALLLLALPLVASATNATATNSTNSSIAPRLTGSEISVFGGTPNGGLNMCGGNIFCRDGFLAPTTNIKDWLGQLSTTVTSVIVGDGPDLAFLDCISVTKVGNAVKDLYVNASSAGGGLTCFATSQIIHSTQASAQGTNFPFADCAKFQQRVMPVFNDCVNYSASVGMWIGVGIASLVGLVALGVGATFLTMYCCDKCRR